MDYTMKIDFFFICKESTKKVLQYLFFLSFKASLIDGMKIKTSTIAFLNVVDWQICQNFYFHPIAQFDLHKSVKEM